MQIELDNVTVIPNKQLQSQATLVFSYDGINMKCYWGTTTDLPEKAEVISEPTNNSHRRLTE